MAVSSYGYDIRVAEEFKIFTNVYSAIVDPKKFDPASMVDFSGPVCVIPPNSFALARTIEYFRIPRGVLTICIGKSTYARCGIIVNVTPFEPEWSGLCHPRNFQHHPSARQDLCQRRDCPGTRFLKAMSRVRSHTPRKKGNIKTSSPLFCQKYEHRTHLAGVEQETAGHRAGRPDLFHQPI